MRGFSKIVIYSQASGKIQTLRKYRAFMSLCSGKTAINWRIPCTFQFPKLHPVCQKINHTRCRTIFHLCIAKVDALYWPQKQTSNFSKQSMHQFRARRFICQQKMPKYSLFIGNLPTHPQYRVFLLCLCLFYISESKWIHFNRACNKQKSLGCVFYKNLKTIEFFKKLYTLPRYRACPIHWSYLKKR